VVTAEVSRFQFDDVVVDRGAMLITKAGARADLEPKAFDVLVYLLQRPGQLVTKTELIEAIWKNVAVTDHVLTRVIGQLRRVLGDDAREARYIETVPTRGYRFVGRIEAPSAIAAHNPAAAEPAPVPAPASGATSPPSGAVKAPPRAVWIGIAAGVALALAAAAGWLALHRREEPSEWTEPPAVARQLTFASALDVYPDFSPDGRFLAYATSASGAFELEVRPMAPDARAQRITSDRQGNIQPDWSPDGQSLAYHSMRAGGVWIIPALGGVARRIAQVGASPAWSPDGRSIVFQSGEPSTVEIGGTPPPSRLVLVDVGSGRQQPLTRVGHPIGAHTEPAWSPGGQRVAFVVRAVSRAEIWSTALDGSEPIRVWSCSGGCSRVAYEPSGRGVIFSVWGQGYFRLALDADTGAAIGRPIQLVSQRGDSAGHIAVSPDGRTVAFTEPAVRSNLYALSLDGRSRAVGEPVAITSNTGRTATPAFSPDGGRVAFAARRETMQICLVAATGGEVTPLPPPKDFAAILRPSWVGSREILAIGVAPSGSAVLSIDPESRETRVIMPLASNEVSESARFLAPSFTADGQDLVFSREDANGVGVWMRNLRTSVERRLTGDGEIGTFPTPSTDGHWIVYERVIDGSMHAVVMPVEGGPGRQLTSGRALVWPHSWSADSTRIFVAIRQEGLWSIGSLSRDTGEVTVLTTLRAPHGYLRYPTVSPKGDRVVYEQTETTGNIWQIALWREMGGRSGTAP
jgi:Tol biopolymer transport system component/DNA-binding winged helix-turn-helix (wHTH) protein